MNKISTDIKAEQELESVGKIIKKARQEHSVRNLNTSEASKDAAARMLIKRIKDMVGVSTEVHVGDAGTVARSQGKAVRVVDKRV